MKNLLQGCERWPKEKNISQMLDQNFIDSFTKLLNELDELQFDIKSPDSVLDLILIKEKAIEESNKLSNKKYKSKCLF
jgi:hypothetical protein